MKNTILISGFEAFGGDTENPTEILVRNLNWLKPPTGWKIHGVILPVTFATSYSVLRDSIIRENPAIVVALGLAAGRRTVDLELYAKNQLSTQIPDNEGYKPEHEIIENTGRAELKTVLPAQKILEHTTHLNLPFSLSESAGSFVCNYLYYRMLSDEVMRGRPSGFIHIPYTSEIAATKKPTPDNLPLAVIQNTLQAVLSLICNNSLI